MTACIAREQISNSHLIKQPRREDHLKQVVDYQSILKLERFSVLHELRTQCFDNVDITDANEQRGKRWTHQQPISRPCICKKHQNNSRECPWNFLLKESKINDASFHSIIIFQMEAPNKIHDKNSNCIPYHTV